MAYFSNGSEGDDYYNRYCSRCVHEPESGEPEDGGCRVWLLHLLHNYDECNKPDSMLHTLIPRTKGGLGNEQCTMFVKRVTQADE